MFLIEWLFKIAVVLLWMSAVYDPIGYNYGVRYVALSLLLFCVLVKIPFIKTLSVNSFLFIWVFIIIIPIWGLFLYSIYDGGTYLRDTSYLGAAFLAMSCLLYDNEKMAKFGLNVMYLVGYMLAVTVIVNGIFLLTTGNWELASYFTTNNIAVIGYREYGPITIPYIYFLASPLLIPTYVIITFKNIKRFSWRNTCLIVIIFSAMVLIGTRSSLMLAVGIPLILAFYYSDRKLVYASVCSSVLLVLIFANSDIFVSAFSTSSPSNAAKLEDFSAYGTLFNDVKTVLFGQGFNAHSWSSEFRQMLGSEFGSKTELTYLEIFRVFGFIVGGLIFLFFVRLLIVLFYKERVLFFILVFLLFNALFNPYLFSFNGILPLAIIVNYKNLRNYSYD